MASKIVLVDMVAVWPSRMVYLFLAHVATSQPNQQLVQLSLPTLLSLLNSFEIVCHSVDGRNNIQTNVDVYISVKVYHDDNLKLGWLVGWKSHQKNA